MIAKRNEDRTARLLAQHVKRLRECGLCPQMGKPVVSGGAVVSRVMPARLRVAVLLEFLGRQTAVELDRGQLIVAAAEGPRRVWMFRPVEALT